MCYVEVYPLYNSAAAVMLSTLLSLVCCLCGILYIFVINIDAVDSKVLPIDRPLKTGQVTVLLVYESYYLSN